MFTLDVDVRAVLFHDGQLLLARQAPNQDHFECIGSKFILGKSLPGMIEQALATRLALAFSVSKLLYIVERFYTRDKTDVHQITHYYLCEPSESEQEAPLELPDAALNSDLKLIKPEEISKEMLEPACLLEVLMADAAESFNVSPKLLVDNQLVEKTSAASGVFRV
jgi:hypothetical protein